MSKPYAYLVRLAVLTTARVRKPEVLLPGEVQQTKLEITTEVQCIAIDPECSPLPFHL